MKIHFLGAAGTVTGSKYLLDTGETRILIDCGLFQGPKELRNLNWGYLPVPEHTIDAVLLTHGHLDHTGYLPRLVNSGFKGFIYGTGPTLDVARIILEDSAEIQEQEAMRANREGYSKHRPARPLYTLEDVEATLTYFKEVPKGEWLGMLEGMRVRFRYNGHIIGSTFIELEINGKRLVFSGDVGRENDLLLYPPVKPEKADILVMESTYGGRFHPEEAEAIPVIGEVVRTTIERGGSVFIPSFSVERAQLLMLILWKLSEEGKIPKIPMIMDSPMGSDVLRLFRSSHAWHSLDEETCRAMCSRFRVVRSFHETIELRDDNQPKLVIAGSGMLTGGRILNYLEKQASNQKNTLLFVGFQAEGTRGRKLLEGERALKIYGKMVYFNLQVAEVEGLSAHGDHEELLNWLSDIRNHPEQVFMVHGEPDEANALAEGILTEYGWECTIPELYSIHSV